MNTQQNKNDRRSFFHRKDSFLSYKDIAMTGVMVATLEAAKLAVSFLPNIELVSLLIILYTLCFGRKTLSAIFTFIILEGLLYGFGLWWISYVYLWPLLHFAVRLFRNHKSVWFWSIFSGFFGLAFGGLCAVPYLFLSGPQAAFTYWIAGIPFDISHCIGNFVLTLILFVPLHRVMRRISSH